MLTACEYRFMAVMRHEGVLFPRIYPVYYKQLQETMQK